MLVFKIFSKKGLTTTRMCGIIYTYQTDEGVIKLNGKKRKLAIQIADLVIKAVVAIAALISAIKWW